MTKCKVTGHIHSTESFGTVDGPGVRFVVFFQGCPMRCQYCHNPDTWEPGLGNEMSVPELLEQYTKNKSFYANGGITATGGEPLMQLDFLIELFKGAKELGIHTCLDTSGIVYRENDARYKELFAYTDLVMLDIKTSDELTHKTLTGCEFGPVLKFAHALEESQVPLRIRHVIVPELTFDQDKLFELGKVIGQFSNLKELEILPYHVMGEKKYEALGIPYPLHGVPALSKQDAAEARKMILSGVKEVRTRK